MVANIPTGALPNKDYPRPPAPATATSPLLQLDSIASEASKSNAGLEESIASLEHLLSRLNGAALEGEKVGEVVTPVGVIPILERELEVLATLLGRLDMACIELKKLA